MQKLGQHFLKDTSVLKKIAATLEIKNGDVIIEIGPGHGELTEFIAKEFIGYSGKLLLVEKDQKLADHLRKRFSKDTAEILEDDILKVLSRLVNDYKLKTINYKLVGNIPYYITGHLFRIISELKTKPERCVFTIQKEVAERIIAKPPRMNLLSASVQIWADPKIIATVPPHAFNPPPKVESAIIKLNTKPYTLNPKPYFKMLHVLFKQPRKTILNNLADGLGKNKTDIAIKLEKVGINPKDRPQNLSLGDIIKLSEIFNN